MKTLRRRIFGLLVCVAVVAAIGATTSRDAQAVLPPLPNTVQQWNKIAEDTVVGSGAFQGEGEIYMSYASLAVYDAVVAIQGGYEPYGPAINAPAGASVDCAVVEAAYRTLHLLLLVHSGLGHEPRRVLLRRTLALEPERMHSRRRARERASDLAAANSIIALRTGDGRLTPIGTTSSFETKDPRPGSLASYSTGVPGPANAVARVGAAVPAEEPGTVPAGTPAPALEQGVGRQFNEVKAYGGRNEHGSHPGADCDRTVLHGERDPTVQHRRP